MVTGTCPEQTEPVYIFIDVVHSGSTLLFQAKQNTLGRDFHRMHERNA